MKIIKQFRKKGEGDLKATYNEEINDEPVFIGRLSCDKKALTDMFGHVPEVFFIEVAEGITTDLW